MDNLIRIIESSAQVRAAQVRHKCGTSAGQVRIKCGAQFGAQFRSRAERVRNAGGCAARRLLPKTTRNGFFTSQSPKTAIKKLKKTAAAPPKVPWASLKETNLAGNRADPLRIRGEDCGTAAAPVRHRCGTGAAPVAADRVRNGFGTGAERVRNGCGTGAERVRNGCGTGAERVRNAGGAGAERRRICGAASSYFGPEPP